MAILGDTNFTQLFTSTLQKYEKTLVDNVLLDHPVLEIFKKSAKSMTGRGLVVPLRAADLSATGYTDASGTHSTAVSADGPQNMLDAIRVVTSPASSGRGVMVVLNDTIFDPRSVTKFDVNRVEAFTAPSRGPIGHVLGLAPRYFGPPQPQPEMLALGEAKLPRIAVVYAYAGQTEDEVRDIVRNADGVIVAGVGAGGVSSGARKALRALADKNIPMVTTPRQGHGDIRRSEPTPAAKSDDDDRVPTIGGRELTPAKARILLMLAMQKRRTFAELQAIFDRAGTTN